MKKALTPTLIVLLISTTAFSQQLLPNDTISLAINEHNTISVKCIFNEKDTLNLNFDTGTTELILTNNTLKNKLSSLPKLYDTLYQLKIGNTSYKTRVYDAELSGHGTDGRFGWDLFKNKIVELNYNKSIMVVHSRVPAYVLDDNTYTSVKINYWKDIFFIESTISQSNVNITDSFLFDTGFERTAMLDNDLLKMESFPIEKMEEIKKTIMKGAQGNEIPVITYNLETLAIGDYKLKNVPAQILTTSKPIKDKNVHILGNEVLKRFNLFLDFRNNVVYLKPNKLYNEEYIDKKKSGI